MRGGSLTPCPRCGHPNGPGVTACAQCATALNGKSRTADVPTSGLAIAALVLAGLSVPTGGLLAPFALPLGIAALIRIALSRGRVRGRAEAIASVAVSIALILGVVYPLIVREVTGARKAQCIANVKRLALAAQVYATDWGSLPGKDRWGEDLAGSVAGERVYTCPTAPKLRSGFAYNASLDRLPISRVSDPARAVVMFESDRGWDASGDRGLLPKEPRHLRGDNIGYVDGHAKWCSRQALTGPDASAWASWQP